MTEQALTLQEAAKALNLSYSTVFGKRHSIGFRLPGSRVWRVWPSSLANLTHRSTLVPLSLRAVEENACLSSNTPSLENGGWTSRPQAVKELNDLLAQPTKKPRRNSTTA